MGIIPAILPVSREDLSQKLARFAGLAEAVQIDVVDGVFAGPASWPYAGGAKELAALSEAGAIPHLGEFALEVDLMTAEPAKTMGPWIDLGASRITVHVESTQELARLIKAFDAEYGHEGGFAPGLIALGLALGMETDPAVLEPFVSKIDYVQFMGIASVGKQGQPFDSRVVERVRAFKQKHPATQVQVDGGVTLETAPALLDAGADRLVVGHALRDAADVKAAFAAFTALTEQYGLYG